MTLSMTVLLLMGEANRRRFPIPGHRFQAANGV